MKKLSAKFHLAMGLTSIVLSLMLVAIFLNLIPDRRQAVIDGRAALSESVAASSSLFLQNRDFSSIRKNLDFILERNQDILAAWVRRSNDPKGIVIGDASQVDTSAELAESTASTIVIPILQGNRQWGTISLYFTPVGGTGWLEQARNSRMSLVALCAIAGFILFYIYLGKMLKELNPSQAVPGRVRAALDTLAEALLVIDKKTNVVLANQAFQTIVGIEAEKLLGREAASFEWHIGESQPAEGEERNTSGAFPWQTALQSGEALFSQMIWIRNKDSQWRKFIVNCSPIMSAGSAGGVLISLDDVTLLEEQEAQLRLARDEAEQANLAKSEFLSNMSHEIRTPMTAILGFTEVLKRGTGKASKDWKKHLNTISSSGNHLLELINDVLDLSKVESGALEVEQIECKPYVVANDVLQVLRVKAEEKGIDIDLRIDSELPEYILSDGGRIRQIITNLTGNAIKFTENGGVSIVIHLHQDDGEPMIAIDVSDTGIGMTDKQQAAVFDPFVQADASITRRFGGTGLGLAISRKLARAMGGDIKLRSEAGVGTTFTALIPTGSLDGVDMLSPEQILERIEQIDSAASQHWEFPPSTILIIDDAAENRELLTLVLQDLGITTETAENGAIGVEMALKGNYDVILSDIQMPVMDGYKAAEAMREAGLTQPIVALTANAMQGFEERILACGFSNYMTKPIDIDALTQLLAKMLGGKAVDAPIGDEPPAEEADVLEPATAEGSIYSRLANKPAFAPIITRFVDQLPGDIDELHQAKKDADNQQIAAIAHRLKGSGGTVGFDALFEPAKQLESAAKAANAAAIDSAMQELVRIAKLVRSGTPANDAPQAPDRIDPAPEGLANSTMQAHELALDADNPIRNSLLEKNPQMKGIVEKFLPRLDQQLNSMEAALQAGDFDQLAQLAHWLKGSGGTVGYDVFTEPAAQLEEYAKSNDGHNATQWLARIQGYAMRIRNAGNDGRHQQRTSA